ncbi:MAG: hypothetical protein WC180_04990, partial [Candidatus Paceibacterota bacterium]
MLLAPGLQIKFQELNAITSVHISLIYWMKVKLSCTEGDETITRSCPLKRKSSDLLIEFGQCEREKCEWWSTFFKECSVTALGFIGFELLKIREA